MVLTDKKQYLANIMTYISIAILIPSERFHHFLGNLQTITE